MKEYRCMKCGKSERMTEHHVGYYVWQGSNCWWHLTYDGAVKRAARLMQFHGPATVQIDDCRTGRRAVPPVPQSRYGARMICSICGETAVCEGGPEDAAWCVHHPDAVIDTIVED